MAQVAQKQGTSTEESSLNKVDSKAFVKKMLAIGISNICYLRNLFPEAAFADRKIEGLPLKILKEKAHEGAGRVVQWMKGVYDAVEKEYLRVLIFAIVKDPNDPVSVVESYTFGFTYTSGTVQTTITVGDEQSTKTTIPTKTETKESAKKLIRNLVVLTTSMDDLPSNVFMTVRLLYYDNVTPPAYQPPGFVEAIREDTLSFVVDNVRIKLGNVITPYTSMKVRVRAQKEYFVSKEGESKKPKLDLDDSQISLTSTVTTANHDESGIASTSQRKQLYQQQQYRDEVEREKSEFLRKHTQVNISKGENDAEYGVKCACYDPANDGFMIMCSVCNYWQHAICFCILEESNVPENHICHVCGCTPDKVCTDPQLYWMKKTQQQELCGWRRTMLNCFDLEHISVAVVSNHLSCTRLMAQKIIGRLTRDQIVSVCKGQKQIKKLNHDRLKEVFDKEMKGTSKDPVPEDPFSFVPKTKVAKMSPQKNIVARENSVSSPNEKDSCSRADLETQKQLAAERRRSLRSSPFNSQCSLNAFREDENQNGHKKRKKMSKISPIRKW